MMHASDAAALFCAADEDDKLEYEDDIDEGLKGDGDEQQEWDSRGGSPVDEPEEDQDSQIIPVRSFF